MATRRSTRRAVGTEDPTPWRTVFTGDVFMLNRFEVLARYGRDDFPDSCGSAILEAQVRALVAGTPRRDAVAHGELVTNVQACVDRLFEMRDQGLPRGA